MSALQDFKEQLIHQLKTTKERVEESSAYNSLKDRFENLTPVGQKSIIAALVLGAIILVMYLPVSFYSSSSDNVASFEKRRALIRDLLRSSKEASETPDIPVPPPMDALKAQVEGALQSFKLIPEQIASIEILGEENGLIPSQLVKGSLRVTLSQLNLRQVVDIGNRLQGIRSSVKLKDLTIDPSKKNAKYFDVVYKLTALNVPEAPPPPPPPPPEPPPTKKNKKAKGKSEDE